MSKRIYSFLLCSILIIFSAFPVKAQDTSRLRISIITCEPGTELYSLFGHSAVRVVDSNFVADVIYNYGTFDFSDPNFYQKFVQGKLKYFLSISSTEDFIQDYTAENRTVTEQVLLLTAIEKRSIRDALAENIKEENRFYLYDFFLDNCTTRLRDLVKRNRQPEINLPAVMSTNFTFRNAIHQYLDSGKMYWSKLGIDILLGAPTDAVMTVDQQKFLPENFMHSLDKNTTGEIVGETNVLYKANEVTGDSFAITPLMCSLLYLLIGILLTYWSIKKAKVSFALRFFDLLLFLLLGLLGCLLIFMWIGTDHTMTKTNYNLLWAIPTHVFAVFLVTSKSKLSKNYFLITSIVSALLLLVWFFLPQQLNTALMPIALLACIRSAHLFFIKRKA